MVRTEEVWKPIVGYEGLYEVSNYGRVKSLYKKTRVVDKVGNIMRQKLDDHGYYRVNLHKNKISRGELVSRLVATAFIDNPKGLPHVGHWDDDKTNNVVGNLYWTDPLENNYHNGKLQRFQQIRNSKIEVIADKLSMRVRAISLTDESEMLFKSMQDAERHGFSSGKISMCVNGKRKSHKGYKWERI